MKKTLFKKTILLSSFTLALSLPVSTAIACTSTKGLSDVQSVKAVRAELYERTRGTIVSSLRTDQIDDIIKNETPLPSNKIDTILGFAPDEDDYLDLSITTINNHGTNIAYSFNTANIKTGKEGKKYELVAKISKGSNATLNFPILIHAHDYIEWTNSSAVDDVKVATEHVNEALEIALSTGVSIVNPNGHFRSKLTNDQIIEGDETDSSDDIIFDENGKVIVSKGDLQDLGLRTGIDFVMPQLPEGVFATYQIVDNHDYDLDSSLSTERTTETPGEEDIYDDEKKLTNTGARYKIDVEIGKRGSVSNRDTSFEIESSDYYSRVQNIANHRIKSVHDFLDKNCFTPGRQRRTSVSSSIDYMKGGNSMLIQSNWKPYDGLTPDITDYGLEQWANGPYRHTPESAPGLPKGVSVLMTFRKETPGRIDGAQYELVFEISAPNGTTDKNNYFFFRTRDWRENN